MQYYKHSSSLLSFFSRLNQLLVEPVFFVMKCDSLRVALASCSDYAPNLLDESLHQCVTGLDQLPDLHSSVVLLKPNLISAAHGTLPCTEPAFIMAVARWFLDQGARVSIGDSPAFGSASSALQKLGIAEELVGMNVSITDFKRIKKVCLADGGTAGVAAAALECDLLINLPRVKAHAQTRVTLAVKNYFGCLVGLRKPCWHMAYGGKNGTFADRLVQLLDVLPDSLTLVDGIVAMHATGPVHGDAYPLAVVGASTNPVAMDLALLKVLGVDPGQSPLMQACSDRGLAAMDWTGLDFSLATPVELQVTDFLVPAELNSVRFNPFRFLRSSLQRLVQADGK
jgi:uncharacterized protein (DUF362 family)